MLKNNYFHFFLLILFFSQYAIGTEYDSYVFPCVKYTREIDQKFLAIQHAKDHVEAQRIIKLMCSDIQQFENVFTHFGEIQEKKAKSILEDMKHYSSPREKNIIEEVTRTLSKNNCTTPLCDSISSSFSKIRCNLESLNTNTLKANALKEIYSQYDSICSQCTHNCATNKQSNQCTSWLFGTALSIHQSDQQKIQNILKKKRQLQKYFAKNIFFQPKSVKKTVAIIENVGKTISRLPFRNAVCNWIIKDNNAIIDRLATSQLDKKQYKKIKAGAAFKIVQHINKIIPVGWTIANAYTLSQKPTIKKMIDFICEKRDASYYSDYIDKSYEYFFIELLECLHRTHLGSLKMLNKNKRFSFDKQKDYTKALVEEPRLKQAIKKEYFKTSEPVNQKISNQNSSSFWDTITHATDVAGLFVQSLSPWYEPSASAMSPHANNGKTGQNIQTKSIIAPPINSTIGNIKDFLSILKNFPLEDHKTNPTLIIFYQMINMHKKLQQDINTHYYEKYKKTNPQLPNEWDQILPEITKLYRRLDKLRDAYKKLWFFHIWNKKDNAMEREKINILLQQHIDAYNMTKIHLYTQNERDQILPEITKPYRQLDKLRDAYKELWFSNILQRIDAYNMTTIHLHTQNETYATIYDNKSQPIYPSEYTKIRTQFLKEFPLSDADMEDIANELKHNPDTNADFRFIFNPLEKTEFNIKRKFIPSTMPIIQKNIPKQEVVAQKSISPVENNLIPDRGPKDKEPMEEKPVKRVEKPSEGIRYEKGKCTL